MIKKSFYRAFKFMTISTFAAAMLLGTSFLGCRKNNGSTSFETSTDHNVYDETSSFEALVSSGTLTTADMRVTVHDPSIVYDPADATYYIFGSHRAWASSKDLINWAYEENNINNDYASIFKTNGEWSARGSKTYDISGNCWAPDVFYNETMKKWCMYMSINGSNYYSSIALATADSIKGPYTYAGTVVYSGFTNEEEAAMTDYAKVTGSNTVDQRYLNGSKSWNSAYGTNCIDPCVFYDKAGDIWMSYGSWFGGIFLIKIDPATGLRDYTYTYATEKNVSDQYLGLKLSGGNSCTGEGSYIVWDEDSGYYYLYLSYGGLNATDSFSGYHIRLFRSKEVTGPYVDIKDNTGICERPGTAQREKGIKLFGNYYLSSLATAPESDNSYKGYMSGGHNSAIITPSGDRFLIYHTRFNLGTEWHQVRVHQQFLNEEGWPVTAVYEYLGSAIRPAGYDMAEIAGEYEYINHGLNYSARYTGMLDTLKVTLHKDGTISGDVTGTWEQKTGSDGNGYYATMVINDITYRGIFFKQYDESAKHNDVMTFSLIGDDDSCVWGSKLN